jgi:hypothetical protein
MLNKTVSDIRFGLSRMQVALGSTDNLAEVAVSIFFSRLFPVVSKLLFSALSRLDLQLTYNLLPG